ESGSQTSAGGKGELEAHARRALEHQGTITALHSKKDGLIRLSGELRRLAALVREAPDADRALNIAKSASLPSDLLPRLESAADGGGQASLSSAIFDRAKRAEREVSEIDSALKLLQSKLKKESEKEEASKVRVIPLSRTKKEWFEKFRWFYTTEGKLAIGGRDAQSNTTLIRKHMQDEDTVYHADLFGSPFFVLKGGREQKEDEVRQMARATVTFSSAWKTGLGAADAYWVAPDQVSSAAPTGEYLAHGSFAIKGKKNFVTKNPVEVALGVDEKGRIVSGPEESIMKVAKAHVAIVPSKEKSSDTAKKVLHELRPYANPEVGLGVDDVLRMLPAGGGKIIRRRVDQKASG
ncbi:MAG: NFACT RNA binding domain-containing protein, partial [Thaumarchaeota archaeon]|nr:NFACT RNA binding domain-containing protein [Nitrososphaerota archaeon]